MPRVELCTSPSVIKAVSFGRSRTLSLIFNFWDFLIFFIFDNGVYFTNLSYLWICLEDSFTPASSIWILILEFLSKLDWNLTFLSLDSFGVGASFILFSCLMFSSFLLILDDGDGFKCDSYLSSKKASSFLLSLRSVV